MMRRPLTLEERWAALCPTVLEGPARGPFRHLDLSALPLGAAVRVCDNPSPTRPGLLLIENLMNASEVADARRIGDSLDDSACETRQWCLNHNCASAGSFGVTRSVEDRIVRILGVPHTRNTQDPASMCFTKKRARNITSGISAAAAADRHCTATPPPMPEVSHKVASGFQTRCRERTTLHLDVGHFSVPWVTVLTYINDACQGGHTIFPEVRPPAEPGGAPSVNRLKLEGLLRSDLPFNGARFNGRRKSVATAMMCAQLDAADASGARFEHLGVPPRAGSAVAFFHFVEHRAAPDDRAPAMADASRVVAIPDAVYWHASCKLKRGSKMTMQSFREPPAAWYAARGAELYYYGASQFRGANWFHCRKGKRLSHGGRPCCTCPRGNVSRRGSGAAGCAALPASYY